MLTQDLTETFKSVIYLSFDNILLYIVYLVNEE